MNAPSSVNSEVFLGLSDFVQACRRRARLDPHGIAYTFLADGETDERNLTYSGLDEAARKLAGELQQRGLSGERALLVYEPGLDYMTAFIGCLYAGVVAIPAYPPDPMRIDRTLPRLKAILQDAQASVVLGTSQGLPWLESLLVSTNGIRLSLATDTLSHSLAADWQPPAICPNDTAFLQYTSATTGAPRGVKITHRNLLYNVEAMYRRFDVPSAVGVTWLPMYHDMGLVGAVLLPVYSGRRNVSMSPLAFVQRPIRWLEAISKYRGTTSAAPNFAYDLTARRVDREEASHLDLSCWRIALTGAEPVRAETIERFSEAFAHCGFSQHAFRPSFGLAEATLAVTGDDPGTAPTLRSYSAAGLERDVAQPSVNGSQPARRLVGCGRPLDGTRIVIADPHTREQLSAGMIGEVWLRAAGVAAGYFNREEESRQTFGARLSQSNDGPFLRTGDLGFLDGDELFITGRLKDLLIIAGRNHYPQDIEHTVAACHPSLKADAGAAFGVERGGQERLIVIQEIVRPKKVDLDALFAKVREEVLAEHDLPLAALVLIKAGTIQKTSSGKIQRHACRDAFLSGGLNVVAGWHEDGPDSAQAIEAPARPATPLERRLCEIWQSVLGIPRVGVNESFFELGGHSLLAGQVVARVQAQFAVDLSLRGFFQAPTVAQLAELIERLGEDRGAAGLAAGAFPAVSAAERSGEEAMAISYPQERLWFLDHLAPESPYYNLAVAARIHGPLDADRLAIALGGLAARHESLRTTFPSVLGKPQPTVAPAAKHPFPLVIDDLRGQAENERDAASERIMRAEAQQPFSLSEGPLLRARLLKLADDEDILLLTMHHIVSDGWSMGVIISDLAELYRAEAGGALPPLDGPRLEYADYAAWQRRHISREAVAPQLDYWQSQLSELPPLDFPADRPRGAVESHEGARVPISIPRELTSKLHRLAQSRGATLYMTLLAAWQGLLGRFSGQEDFGVGCPMAGRRQQELERIVGFFVNTLVLRADLSANPSFVELLDRCRETALGAFANQDVPFEWLVDKLAPARDLSRNPLFQTMLVLQNAPLGPLGDGELVIEPLDVETGISKFDLTLSLRESQRGLQGEIEFKTRLFDRATIDELARCFVELLESATDNPRGRLWDLPVVSGDLERELIEAVPKVRSPAAVSLAHQLLERQAEAQPAAVAVEGERESLTYGDLNFAANRLARELKSRGIGRGDVVGVSLPRSPAAMTAIFAVLKTGAAYLPLDGEQPLSRLRAMIADAGAGWLMIDRRQHSMLADCGANCLALDDLQGNDDPAAENLDPPISAADPAYVIFTSGSSGRPKGVVVEHGSLINLAFAQRESFGCQPADRVLQFASLTFDASVSEIFVTFAAGGTLCLTEEKLAGDSLAEALRSRRITAVTLPPTVLATLPQADFPALQTLVSAGESCSPDLVRRWAPGRRFINAYGPTEATVCAALGDCRDGNGPPSIGLALDGATVNLLDRSMRPAPRGAVAEIYVGGAGVARGYAGRAALTAERFVPDPFGQPGSRLYRTGDLARRRAGGDLEFLGRADDQIKVRGHRVEPAEVEEALRRHSIVREVAVGVVDFSAARIEISSQLLAAWIVAEGEQPLDEAELRRHAAGELPEYMVPGIFIPVAELPRTASGKIDRKRLPVPTERPKGGVCSPPSGSRETALAAIWSRLLGIECISAADNFFALGGDSILAIQLVSRAREAGLHFTPRDVFLHQTLGELAAAAGDAPAATTPQGPVTGEIPLTPIQRWFFREHPEHREGFCHAVLLDFSEPPNDAALERALSSLIEHHDALRTRFRITDGGAGVEAHLAHPDECGGFSLKRSMGGDAASLASALMAGLDLASGPLLAASLVERDGRVKLLLVAHHLVVDGISWRILLEDLASAYRQLTAGEAPALPAKTAPWKAWAEYVSPPQGRAEQLRGAEGPRVTDAESIEFSIDRDATGALLREATAAFRAEPGELLLTALALALRGEAEEWGAEIHVERHGRDSAPHLDVTRTVGWFTALDRVSLRLNGESDDASCVRAIKAQSRSPLVPDEGAAPPGIVFNYLGRPGGGDAEAPFSLSDESPGLIRHPRLRLAHEVEVNATIRRGKLHVAWTFGGSQERRRQVAAAAAAQAGIIGRLAAGSRKDGPAAWIPSDFPLAAIDQPALDVLRRELPGDIEDVYPLAPMQAGILFHSLYDEKLGLYFEQASCTLEGELDPALFRASWESVVGRHAVLRTGFLWRDLDEPLQVVRRSALLPWRCEDWSDQAEEDQAAGLEAFLEEDRRCGFDLAEPPLMRLALFRCGPAKWRFVWSHHHLLLDGWSMPIVLDEVWRSYAALTAGETPQIMSTPQYRDFVAAQAKTDRADDAGFWRQRFEDFNSAAALPGEQRSGRTDAASCESEPFGELDFSLSAGELRTLEGQARTAGVTLFAVLAGAWAMALSRYGGQRDVVFGTTTSGRSNSPQWERAVGLFINTLPLRIKLDEDESVAAWLRHVQSELAAIQSHEHTPLTDVQRLSGLPAGAPLFESLLIYENYPFDRAVLSSGAIRVTDARVREWTNYPLTVAAVPGDGLAVRMTFDRRRISRRLIQQAASHFRRLILELPRDTRRRLHEVPMLTPREERRLIGELGNGKPAQPAAPPVTRLIESRAAAAPDSTALVCGNSAWTYRRLNEESNRIAYRLAGLGVGSRSIVGVCLPRSPELIAALLGVLKAGAAYLPLDPDHPPERLAWMLDDSGATVLLSDVVTSRFLGGFCGRRLLLEEIREQNGRASTQDPSASAAPTDLAYVIYTSGSTGRPKGVMVRHGGLSNLAEAQGEAFALTPADRVLQFASISFDASVSEIFVTLAAGAALCLADREELLPGEPLTSTLRHYGISCVTLPPSALALLSPDELPHIKTVVSAGEPCPEEIARRWHVGRRLINAYGPTEATVCATWKVIEADGPPSIGRPMHGVQALVLDRRMQPLPPGAAGELFLGGSGVAAGYLGRPKLTAERFVPSPFAGGPNADGMARLYRTGDLARWTADGELEFLGRADRQLKLRGIRIEPAEIEAALAGHPAVLQAIVEPLPDGSGGLNLAAFYMPATGAIPPDADELREFLRGSLPEYMLPGRFVPVDAVPLTASGKIDRRALAGLIPGDAQREHVPPQGDTERAVAEIWQEVLPAANVGATDGFFELGGHSLLATQVISRVRRRLGVELPLKALFESATVRRLARRIDEAKERGGPGAEQPIVRAGRGEAGVLPLSPAQERLYFLSQLAPESPFYNTFAAVELAGPLDAAAMRTAVETVVRRHESLRTTFGAHEGIPFQRIAGPNEAVIDFAALDLSSLPDEARGEEVERIARREARQPFDIAAGPLLRARLLQVSPQEHVFLLAVHHLVSDGWSMGVLVGELRAAYRAALLGEPTGLPPLPLQYGDFAVWQRRRLREDSVQRQIEFWRRELEGVPPLELPTDAPRPPKQDFAGAHLPIHIPAGLIERLERISQEHGGTLFLGVLAAWNALLARHSGQSNFAVGTPIAGRDRQELEPLVGFFVNTLVLRADLSGNPSFAELLDRTRRTMLAAHEHQDAPFERLAQELVRDRDPSRNPLFQAAFGFESFSAAAIDGGGDLAVNPLEIETGIAKFDITLSLRRTPQGLHGTIEYATSLFAAETIKRMREHFLRLLEAVVENPGAPVREARLLSQAGEQTLLIGFNRSDRDKAFGDACVHRLVEEQAERTPDAPALLCGDDSVSYAELNRRANRLAHRLREKGAGPETIVGLCVERSPEMVVALLAILKAGGAYLPLDADYPADRLKFMLEDAGAEVLITRGPLLARLPEFGGPTILIDDEAEAIARLSEENPAAGVEPDNLIYVTYTSGSTGRPKGVSIAHRGAARLLAADFLAVRPDDVLMQFAPLSFDASTLEIWAPLVHGARLAIVPPGMPSLEELCDFIEGRRVSILWITTGLFHQLAERHLSRLRGVRQLLTGGEVINPRLVEKARRELPDMEFVNAYGPTENTTFSTCSQVLSVRRPVPIGRPISGSTAYVLDAVLRPAPIGVAGELYLGGEGLARGYRRRAGLTAERFIPNPFGRPGERLYRTGDRVRWLPSGELDFVGRVDNQIKLRGFRIELAEIEAVLSRLPSVKGAVVLLREDQPGEKRLVAYVVHGPGEPPSADRLRRQIKAELPDYMVPSAFVLLKELPLSRNGKIDRAALPAPDQERPDFDQPYVPPQGEIERELAAIWQQVLPLEQIGRHDSFFDLGGHSLLATQVVTRVRQAFEIDLPLRSLFEGPTIADMGREVETRLNEDGGGRLPPICRVARDGDLPLSHAQERLWFLCQLAPNHAFYNVPMAVRFRGGVSAEALRSSLREIVRRHESLRTIFPEVGDRPVQRILPALDLETPLVDLTSLPAEDREARALQLAREDSRLPFDLQRGPLVRASLLRLADDDHVLLLSIHHIVCDGWSMGVLVKEFCELYEAETCPGTDCQPVAESVPVDSRLQYADFSAWQRQWLTGDVLRSQLDYWKDRLAELPALDLPTDRPRPAVESFAGDSVRRRLSPELASRLRAFSREQGVTLFVTLLSAFKILLHRYTRRRDIVVGTGVAGRNRPELEELVGFFVNTLVMRSEVSGGLTTRELLRRVQNASLEAFANQDVPFETLVEELRPERAADRNPLCQVCFVLQNFPLRRDALPGLEVERLEIENDTSKFDLTLYAFDSPGGLETSLEYNTALFDRATIERLHDCLERLLDELTARPDEPIAELDLLGEAQRDVLAVWRTSRAAAQTSLAAGEKKPPAALCLHELVEQQAQQLGSRVAVEFDGEDVTYQDLNARANRLAHLLRRRGIGKGSVVAVSMDRSPDLVASLLGILKAGAAYLPLDVEYPTARLAQMMGDSRAKLLLTDSAAQAALPDWSGKRLVLDELRAELSQLPEDNPRAAVAGDDPAYVIFTSGSTGRPKGVAVPHAALCNLAQAQQVGFGVTPDDRVLQFASICFDASVSEIFVTLAAGAALCLAPKNRLLPGQPLIEVLDDLRITMATLPPSVLAALPDAELPHLTTIISAGESCSRELVQKWSGSRRFINAYGPTETTVCVSLGDCGSAEPRPTIGRPMQGVEVFVLDERLQPAPIGGRGELYVGGAGLSRGYVSRPGLTAERFVPNPFGAHGERLYRTGDLVRWMNDGRLQFLGRTDDQVKIRGFRIEPAEIEASLVQHALVREAAVVVREDRPGDPRLIGYVALDQRAMSNGRLSSRRRDWVSSWRRYYDEAYAAPQKLSDPTIDTSGWRSSYTGEQFADETMRHWRDDAAAAILARRPEDVLEIGVGTGLLMFAVAPHCRRYVATDLSEAVIDGLSARLRERNGELAHVTLQQRAADEFTGLAPAGFDAVVLHSVVQYFPDVDYLLDVLDGAVSVLRPGGLLFIGDVRNLPLLAAFHSSVHVERAAPSLAVDEIRGQVKAGVSLEEELVLDPAFFHALRQRYPQIADVQVRLKSGEDNELTRFRYDVSLELGGPAVESAAVADWQDWSQEGLSPAEWAKRLGTERPETIALKSVPNSRVVPDVLTAARLAEKNGVYTAADLRQAVAAAARVGRGVDPNDWQRSFAPLGYEAVVTWPGSVNGHSGATGCYDVLLRRLDAAGEKRIGSSPPRPDDGQRLSDLANQPVRRGLAADVQSDLRKFLRARLPDYMVPSVIVPLAEMPHTPAGKIDRRALPAPGGEARGRKGEYIAPQNRTEQLLADIWRDVLAVDRVGTGDSFFDLGGHSLLATQAVSRIRKRLHFNLPLSALFESPTIAELAKRIEDGLEEGREERDSSIPPVARGGDLPLSFAQERLWFLDQLAPNNPFYNIPEAVRLSGGLDGAALRESLAEIVARHEPLRTVFPSVEGRPVQRILPKLTIEIPLVDLSGLAEPAQRTRFEELARRESEATFDLAAGPLLRAQLVRLAEQEHVLLVTMHHVVSDGWSVGVLVREFTRIYRALREGSSPDLPPLEIQYADYAVWQRRELTGKTLQEQLSYWRRQLADLPALNLPADRPRPAVETFAGSAVRRRLPRRLADAAESLARERGATSFAVLLAAFKLLLARYSGQSDLAVGTGMAGRTRREIEDLIGFFVNTLVMRTDLAAAATFADAVERVRETCLGAYTHQDVPFESVVEHLRPERKADRNPLCQVCFVLQNFPGLSADLPELTIEHVPLETHTAKFDLTLYLFDSGDALEASLEFNTDLFDRETIERMLERFELMLERLLAAPLAPLANVSLMREDERQRLLNEWSRTPAASLSAASVQELFARQAASRPGAAALRCAETAVTYGELERASNRLANYLIQRGVRPRDVVGVCLDRSIERIVALLAILKTGAAYLPLDAELPAGRLAQMRRDAGATLTVTAAALEAGLPASDGPVVRIDECGPLEEFSAAPPAIETLPDDLAYVTFTSGSTGVPKGVAVPHRGVVRLVEADYLDSSESDVFLHFAPLAFDASTLEIWTPLCTGATLAIHPSSQPSLEELGACIRREGVTVLWLTAGLFHQMVDLRLGDLTGVRILLAGGDVLSPQHVARCLESLTRTTLINGYGPTESTTFTCCHRMESGQSVAGRVPIGRPISHTDVYVLDPNLQPVPAGVPGELYVGGAGLARGYRGRPQLTAERFLPHPFGQNGSRLYKTGDLCRWRSDGRLDFLGRIDQQVKLRGYRIEPGEIEAALADHPAVAKSAVLAREDQPGDARLVAYVIPREERPAPGNMSSWRRERIAHWQTLYEDTYGQDDEPEDVTFDITGWESSYTGEPLSPAEMRVWREQTVEPILDRRPSDVLEIGVGTGLLMFELAPRCRRYVGTDFSPTVIERLERRMRQVDLPLDRVELRRATADDFRGLESDSFDAVILNSVVQYFPSVEYLLEVIDGAMARLRPGGLLFIGDVRHLPLLETFHTSVQLHRAAAGVTTPQLRERIRARLLHEEELVLDPALFHALRERYAGIGDVQIRLKRGRHDNELNNYRYDVVIHKGDGSGRRENADWRRWNRETDSPAAIEALLAAERPPHLALAGVSNARLAAQIAAAAALHDEAGPRHCGDLRQRIGELECIADGAIHPDDWRELAARRGYRAIVTWPGSGGESAPGAYDVLLVRDDLAAGTPASSPPLPPEHRPPQELANDPLRGKLLSQLAPELKEHLSERLPAYMVPTHILLLDELPLTKNGKLDRARLPAPDGRRPDLEEHFIAPETATETVLAGIWQAVLGIDRVGADDNFFDLGGHSLLATQVVSRAAVEFAVELPLRALFEGPTVRQLAARLDELLAAPRTADPPPPIEPASRAAAPPLSYAQERLWFLDRLAPDNPFYNISAAVRLEGELDAEALRQALQAVVDRHESLRTTFPASDDRPIQRIHPSVALPFSLVELGGIAPGEREAQARLLADEEAQTPFDLAAGPLIRGRLIRFDRRDHVLLLTVHHAVADGWSMGVLVKEFAALYRAAIGGGECPLPPLPVQYADYAVWQRQWLSGERYQRQLSYWREKLTGAADLELPADRPRPARPEFSGDSVRRTWGKELTDSLVQLGRREDATLYVTLLAAFKLLLSRYSGQTDIVVGTGVAGRPRPELEDLIGFFVNTLVMRTDLAGAESFHDLVQRVKETSLEAFAHQDLPFEKLVAELAPQRSGRDNPLCRACFVLQNFPVPHVELADLNISLLPAENRTAKFDLSLFVFQVQRGLSACLEYSTELFERETAEQLMDHFEGLLEAVAAEQRGEGE